MSDGTGAVSQLLRAWANGDLQARDELVPLVYHELRKRASGYLRHERPEGVTELDTSGVLDSGVAIPESVAHAEDLQLLIHAIQSLPDRCRQIMTLRKIYGLSQKEVATRLDISEHTVEAQGAIGLRKCIEYFRRHGYGKPSAGRAPNS